MTFIFPLLLFLVLAACIGFLYPEGMWSNAVRLINVVTAGLVATNYWEPLARMAESYIGESFTFFWDFLCIWALFGLTLVLMQLITNRVSQVKVRFLTIADRIGSGVFVFAVGWVMVCFITFSLHTAPLCRNFLFEGFKPGEANFLGLSPDSMWLSFAEHTSGGVFATNPETAFPAQSFIDNYTRRREKIEEYRTTKKAFRVDSADYGTTVPKR
ncbi:MAG: CvpA family protein [Thermoguttaceae bacterium]